MLSFSCLACCAQAKQIADSEEVDRAFYAAQQARQEKLSKNTKIAAEKLRIQRARDAAAEKAGWEARYAAEEAEQIDHIRALNAGVFGAAEAGRQRNAEYAARRAQVEQQVADAKFMQRRIEAEAERLAAFTEAALAEQDRVQAASDAEAWAPRFARMPEEAEQDALQQAFRDRRAADRAAAIARNAETA